MAEGTPASRIGRVIARMSWCAAGCAVGLGLVLWLVDPPLELLLLASFGGSGVFLFGLTRAPAAQPRALVGGHLIGAATGVVCVQLLGGETWVYVLAVVLTLILMLATKTVHPPAGANPLMMVHAHAGFHMLWQPVLLGVLLLMAVAIVWSRLVPGMVRYPHRWLDKSPPSLFWGGWIE